MLSLRKSARIKYPDRCRFPDLPEFGIALVKLRGTEFLPVDTELDPLSGHFKIIYLYPKPESVNPKGENVLKIE